MDLHDFRRQWQQQPTPAAKPDLTHQKLQVMLAHQTDSPVSEMLRNARRDQRMIFLVIVLNVGNLASLISRRMQGSSPFLLQITVALMIVFVSWHMYRQRQLIRQLSQGDGSTYGHLRTSIRQLRTLIRNKQYGAMAFLVTVVLTVAYGKRAAIMAHLHAGTIDWALTITVLLTSLLLVSGLLYFSRLRQQRRYGRHLDRLEEALRELN